MSHKYAHNKLAGFSKGLFFDGWTKTANVCAPKQIETQTGMRVTNTFHSHAILETSQNHKWTFCEISWESNRDASSHVICECIQMRFGFYYDFIHFGIWHISHMDGVSVSFVFTTEEINSYMFGMKTEWLINIFLVLRFAWIYLYSQTFSWSRTDRHQKTSIPKDNPRMPCSEISQTIYVS